MGESIQSNTSRGWQTLYRGFKELHILKEGFEIALQMRSEQSQIQFTSAIRVLNMTS